LPSFPPAQADFEAYFPSDFKYGSGTDSITPVDIAKAIGEAGVEFNPSLWDSVTAQVTLPYGAFTEQMVAYLYLSAHLLVKNLKGRKLSGVSPWHGAKSRGGGPVVSSSVGSVSKTMVLPDWITSSPILSNLLETDYGKRYQEMLSQRLVGNVAIVSGQSDFGSGVAPLGGL
jgi:hypothetical protein